MESLINLKSYPVSRVLPILLEDKTTKENIIFATGGCSYPTSGSDGNIFEVLQRDLGTDIVPPKPALSPIKVENYPYTDLSGIAFPSGSVTLTDGDQRLA